MADRHHSIGEVLALLQEEFPDVTVSKIRFLEKEGLIEPERTPSGYRKFYDDDLLRLRYILREQRESYLPLKVIKQRLDDGTADLGGGGDEAEAASAPPADPASVAPTIAPTTAPEDTGASSAAADRRQPEAAMTSVSMTGDELAAASGLDGAAIAELERFGMLGGRTVGSAVLYDDDDLTVARLAAAFAGHGIDARHLRMYKIAADREAGFLEQLVAPRLHGPRPGARQEALDLARELTGLGDRLRDVFLNRSLREQLGSG